MSTTGGPITSSAVNFLTYVADYSGNPGSVGGALSVEPSATQVVVEDISLLSPLCGGQSGLMIDSVAGTEVFLT